MKQLLAVALLVAVTLIIAQNVSAQGPRSAKTPRAAEPLARHGGTTAFDALVASRRGLAAAQNATAQKIAANAREGITTFDVPASGGDGTLPVVVNLAGTIAGNYYDSNSVSHGFLRNPHGTFTTLDAPGAGTVPSDFNGTFPMDINQFGTVAGYYNDDNLVSHCFILSPNGTFTTFDVPGADTNPADALGSLITAINALGATSGYYLDSNFVAHGFLRSPDGKFTSFDVPGSGGNGTFAVGHMNVEGAIVGFYTDPNYQYYAFLRNPDSTFATFLGPGACLTGVFAGCAGGGAFDINPSGTSVGAYQTTTGDLIAFLRSRDGTITTFEAPGAGTGTFQGTGAFDFFGTLEGLNDSGAVTGTYLDANNVFHGFLRKPNGTFVTFDAPGADLTPGDFNGTVPDSINELGVITGFYYDSNFVPHGFVFTTHP